MSDLCSFQGQESSWTWNMSKDQLSTINQNWIYKFTDLGTAVWQLIPEWKISTSLHSHSFSTNMYKYFLSVLKDIHIYMCMYAVLQVFVYSKIGQTRCYQVLVLICLRSITKLRKKIYKIEKNCKHNRCLEGCCGMVSKDDLLAT